MLQLPPLSLYIHIPWCVRKCPYCDFNSHAMATDSLPEAAYLAALLEDLDQDLAAVQGRAIHTLFIGGGTPSLMSVDFYRRLFGALQQRLRFAADIEITLEANPGSADEAHFSGYRAAGINRLSIGVQSFDDAQLKRLGRVHDRSRAITAITALRQAGFERFNIDLMHGLPGQTPASACADLATALTLAPTHLSWYQLTLEPNTHFYSQPPTLPEDDQLAAIQDAGSHLLAQAGFDCYEVSAWSQPGQQARHNLNYWQFGDYLAIGAGAHGKITWQDSGAIERYWKTRQPTAYLQRIGSRTAGREAIEPDQRPLEFLMNALRLREGVEESLFSQRTGLPIEILADKLAGLRRDQLLHPHRLQATALGFRHLNSLLERCLP